MTLSYSISIRAQADAAGAITPEAASSLIRVLDSLDRDPALLSAAVGGAGAHSTPIHHAMLGVAILRAAVASAIESTTH